MEVSLFGGTGFIGSRYKQLYHDNTYVHDRESNHPIYGNVLYMISTTHNYHVYEDPYLDINTNLVKLISVLENCKNDNIVFNFISSWFVYGQQSEIPARETSICNPTGFYSITKKCAEDLLISYCKTFNIKYRILRLGNVYGVGDKGVSKKKNALQYLINEIKNNKDIELYYDGHFLRDYIYVDDVCKAINLCVKTAPINEIINVGSGIPQNFREIIDFVMKETGSSTKIRTKDAFDFHKIVQIKDFYLDISKLQSLGFKQEIDIFSGVRKILKN